MVATAITLGQPVLPGRLPFSKPKVNWLLQEKTIKNLGADIPSRKRTNVRYNLTQLTNVNPNSIWDNKQNTYGKRISIMS